MLVWPMAANAPSAIEAMSEGHHDLPPLRRHRRERGDEHAEQSAMAASLGAAAKKAVTGVERAFLVDVGRPHMEGHGRDLEGETAIRNTRPKRMAVLAPRCTPRDVKLGRW